MKKSIYTGVSALALLVAAPALAQNNQSVIDQSGNNAAATVTQSGANSISDVEQLSGGVVNVTQSGSTGSTSNVKTEADSALAPPANTVDVTQTDAGTGPATSQANVSDVIQDNVNLGSSVSVDQTHNIAGEERNYSNVRQGRNASNGDVVVDQNGGDNVSNYTSTTSTDNDATIVQTGSNNNSDVQQDFQNGGARVDVSQNNAGGADNDVFIDQISAGFATTPVQFAIGAEAVALQDGSGNSSTISQTGYAATASVSNYASSSQIGDDLTSTIGQSGYDNTAVAEQTGFDNESTILQPGNGNTALVGQGLNGNVSNVNQTGNGNNVSVGQNAPAPGGI